MNFLKRHRWKLLIGLAVTLVLAGLAYIYRDQLSRQMLEDYGKSLPAGWFIAAFLILPPLGFPVSIFMVLAGIRFGFTGGMAVATLCVFFHNAAAYYVSHFWLREKITTRLEKSGHSIPRIGENRRVWYTALFAAVHGPPYAMKLFMLALTDVPFRIYLWVGAPVYLLFAAIPVGAGSAVTTFDPKWIYLLVGVATVATIATHVLKQRANRSAG